MAAVAFMLAAPLEAFAQNDSGGYILEGARGDVERVLRNMNVGTLTRFETAPSVYMTPDSDELKLLEDRVRLANQQTGQTDVRLQRHAAPAESIFSVEGRRALTDQEKFAGDRIALQGMRVLNVLRLAPPLVVADAFQRDGGQRVALPLPDGEFEYFEAVDSDAPRFFGRARFWIGQARLPDGGVAQAELMVVDGAISARVRTPEGDYSYQQLSGETFAVTAPAEREPLTPDHPGSALDGASRDGPAGVRGSSPASTCPAGAVLNVLFVFSQAAKQGLSNPEEPVYYALNEFNTALLNSGISSFTVSPLPLVLVSAYADDANKSPCDGLGDCSSNQTDQGWVRHLTRLHTAGDGYLEDVFAERDRVKADVVVLVIRDARTCGMAHPNALGGRTTRDTAFAVVAISCLSPRATLAHELGHLLGSRHEDEAHTSADNFAFSAPDPNNGWASVGARTCYPQSGSFRDLCPRNRHTSGQQQRSPVFANPSIVPAGVSLPAQRNEAEAIRRFGPCVARLGD